jgi:membrane-associated progesterone receptor component
MPYSWLWWTAIGIVGSGVAVQWQKDRINLFLMGVFRDIGRHKAYKRRFAGESVALMTLLLHQEEDPLLGSINRDEEDEDEKNSNVPTYTLEELWEFGNGNDDLPLLISIFGRIYDVSAGEKFYGPKGSYPQFPGRDVTYALSTGCRNCASDPTKTAADLTPSQLDEGKRWLSFFQLHDKYPYVGKLDRHPMEAQMNQWIDEAMANKDESDMERQAAIPPIPILN